MCEVAFQILEAVLYDTRMSTYEASRFARRMTALGYYTASGVSIGYCAQIAGMSEEEFIEFLSEHKVSEFQFDSEDEFDRELANA